MSPAYRNLIAFLADGPPSTDAALHQAVAAPLRPHALLLKLWRAAAALRDGQPTLLVRARLAPGRQRPAGGLALSSARPAPTYVASEADWRSAAWTEGRLAALADELEAAQGGAAAVGAYKPPVGSTPFDRQLGRAGAAMERQEARVAWLALEYGKTVVGGRVAGWLAGWGGLGGMGSWRVGVTARLDSISYRHSPKYHPTPTNTDPPNHRPPQPWRQAMRDLPSLLGPGIAQLGALPALEAALGAAVKADRARAWPVYRAFRTLYTPNKVRVCGWGTGGMHMVVCVERAKDSRGCACCREGARRICPAFLLIIRSPTPPPTHPHTTPRSRAGCAATPPPRPAWPPTCARARSSRYRTPR
jgi:hypothetical protein